MPTYILIVRHGQTAWNKNPRFRGQTDVPLDETGLWQAEMTARYIAARWPLQAVYASPMGRAMQTATAIATAQGLTAQQAVSLIDINFGRLQGVSLSDAIVSHPAIMRAWRDTPQTVHFPGGESLDNVRQRVQEALQMAVTAHENETVALVAHTVVNRVLICAALDLGHDYFWQLGQDTCAVNLLEWDGKSFRLMLLNDTSHLWQG